LFDLIAATVVPVGAVQPGHDGDVLPDVGPNGHRFQDLSEPFVVGHIDSPRRLSAAGRPGPGLMDSDPVSRVQLLLRALNELAIPLGIESGSPDDVMIRSE
jgi:hypothetical protein